MTSYTVPPDDGSAKWRRDWGWTRKRRNPPAKHNESWKWRSSIGGRGAPNADDAKGNDDAQ